MRQLVINELIADDHKKIKSFLDANLETGALPGIYWLTIPSHLLGDTQTSHEQCGPYVVGIELLEENIAVELLVRSKSNLHCSCAAYANLEQRQFIIDFYDRIIQETNLQA